MPESAADVLNATLAKLDGGATVTPADGDGASARSVPGPAADLAVGDLVSTGDLDGRHGRIVDRWVDRETGEATFRVVAGVRSRTEKGRRRYSVVDYTIPAGDLDLALTVQVRYDGRRTDHLVASLLVAAADELERRHHREYGLIHGWADTLDRAVREAGR